MPTIKPISELQRNYSEIVREAMETKEPIYLTRNGASAIVVIDAETYDRQQRTLKQLHQDYVRTCIELGQMQNDGGRSVSWDHVKQQLREMWGEDVI